MLTLVTPATSEPITVADVKIHLRITSTEDDLMIPSLITAARMQAEHYTKRQFMPATWKLILQDFPGTTGDIILPRPPLSSSATDVSISFYKDTTIVNDSTSVASSIYTIDYLKEPGRIYPIYGNEWPSCVTDYKKDAVQITFKSGATVVDEPIKLWIKMRVASMYENREPLYEGKFGIQLLSLSHNFYDGLLDPYKVYDYQ